MEHTDVIGLMSGTSLDGVDIACVDFSHDAGGWHYRLAGATTVAYSEDWRKRLSEAHRLSGEALTHLDFEYGRYLGKLVQDFVADTGCKPALISSHGHTVFHRPEQGFTLQIGRGEAIAALNGCPVVYDFRSSDVLMGGQGAPLVPIGDELLFERYSACVNIGGFANISVKKEGQRQAWDIGPANIVLNAVASSLGYAYDRGGRLAARGKLISGLLERLEALNYYRLAPPKSLGREWVEQMLWPMIKPLMPRGQDLLHTLSVHIARRIAEALPGQGEVLFTGGGTFNDFLMEHIRRQSKATVSIPSENLIAYKEALIFALMGLLRFQNKINILSSVTGAYRSHSGGKVVLP